MAWIEKDLKVHLISTLLPCAELPTTGPEPHPAWMMGSLLELSEGCPGLGLAQGWSTASPLAPELASVCQKHILNGLRAS